MTQPQRFSFLLLLLCTLPLSAQTENSASLYGEANLSVDFSSSGNSRFASDARNTRLASNSSRLGFKGEENLGNGLLALWQIESKVHMDSGDSSLATRNTYAGLKHANWGQLTLGHQDSPYKSATRNLYLFGDTVGSSHALMGGAVKGTNSALAFAARKNNLLTYSSPAWDGVTVHAAYSAGAELASSPNTLRGHSQALAAIYDQHPWRAALAYQANFIGSTGSGESAGNNDLGMQKVKESAWKLGLGYDFGNLEFNFVYEQTRDDINRAGSAYTCTSTSTSSDCYGHSAWFLAAQYERAEDSFKLARLSISDLGGGAVADSAATQWVAGVDHHLSKRTSLQLTYSKLFNREQAAYGIGSSDGGGVLPPSGAGADPSVWSFGIKHYF